MLAVRSLTMRVRPSTLIVGLVALAACSESLTEETGPGNGSGGGSGPNGRDTRYVCQPDAPEPAEAPLRRLTRRQLLRTIDRLVEDFAPGAASSIASDIAPAIARVPADIPVGVLHGGSVRLDQTVQQQFSEATYELAIATAAALTSSQERIGEVVGACATNDSTSDDDQCLADFVRRFGERALRGPLTDEDVAFFVGSIEDPPVSSPALATVIGLLLTAPEFLYHVERGVPDGPATGRIPLTPHELAARLSYQLWDGPPDDELRELADSGELADAAVYEDQVERMLTDPRAAETLGNFFAEWLQLDGVPELDTAIGDPRFDAFAGDLVPTPELREAMIADVVRAAQYEMRTGGSLSSFLTNTRAFTDDATLAEIYGTAPWDGEGEAPEAPARTGLLTRPALLVSGTLDTRPIKKGVFLRTGLLCDTLPPVPPDADLVPPAATGELTTREALEIKTETAGTSCAGCHTPSINHLGYATEDFDALGRHRTVQTLYDELGNPTADRPVDTRSVPQVVLGDDTPSTGVADLTRLIDASGKMHSCLAREYVRFTLQRLENELADGCLLADVEEQVQQDRPLVEVFAFVVLQDGFKTKRFE